MPDMLKFKTLITDRLAELGVRMRDIETELDQPKPKDAEERAVDLEDDEVLEGLGLAAQKEARQLRAALGRIEDGSFGTCERCGADISDERLGAVPHTVLCRNCAVALEKAASA